MGGTELVYNLFAECREGGMNTHSGLCVLNPPTQAMPVISAIFVALLVKGALTIVTFGIKVPAGIFIPTLGGKLVLIANHGTIAHPAVQSVLVPYVSLVSSFSGCSFRIHTIPCSLPARGT